MGMRDAREILRLKASSVSTHEIAPLSTINRWNGSLVYWLPRTVGVMQHRTRAPAPPDRH
jgi:hypothetical protein